MKNFLIVHYNTPKLTECLIKSINKFVGMDCHIYIFDNSDKAPFSYKQNNITIFDNTHGDIINFDKELQKYPNHKFSLGSRSKWGSFKHCISVDTCFDLIHDNFVLMDSDILLKKDVSELFDEKYYSVGEVNEWSWGSNTKIFPIHKRVVPFLCFINVKKCQNEGIRFYNSEFMDGLYDSTHHGTNNIEQMNKDSYDTGCWFYQSIETKPMKLIKCDDYIVHFRGGSYTSRGRNENMTQDGWLKKYENFYLMPHNKKNNKKVVYTCITGGYDKLLEPSFVTSDFNYVCYTDDKTISSNIWEIKNIPNSLQGLDNKRINRYIKTHPHEFFSEYDLSIYVDGSVLIKSNLNEFLNKQCNTDDVIFVPSHPIRNCIYKEANICAAIKKDTKETIDKQMKCYRNEKFPDNYGLTQNNIIVRRHNDETCIKVMEAWWDEIKNHSYRDQLSFMYVIWKTPDIKLKKLDRATCNSIYFKWNPVHNRVMPEKKKFQPTISTPNTSYGIKKSTPAKVNKVVTNETTTRKLKQKNINTELVKFDLSGLSGGKCKKAIKVNENKINNTIIKTNQEPPKQKQEVKTDNSPVVIKRQATRVLKRETPVTQIKQKNKNIKDKKKIGNGFFR